MGGAGSIKSVKEMDKLAGNSPGVTKFSDIMRAASAGTQYEDEINRQAGTGKYDPSNAAKVLTPSGQESAEALRAKQAAALAVGRQSTILTNSTLGSPNTSRSTLSGA
jgi:hypothetical protein